MFGLSASELGLVLFLFLLIVLSGKLPRWGESLGEYAAGYRRGGPSDDGETAGGAREGQSGGDGDEETEPPASV